MREKADSNQRNQPEPQSKAEILQRGLEAISSMREIAIASGNADMSLDEINAIISEVRNGN